MSESTIDPPQTESRSTTPKEPDHYRERLELAMGIPFSDGNVVRVLNNGDEIFPAMLEAISAARRTIDFETYVYWRGDIAERFAEALVERARAGVRVRVLLDSVGAKKMKQVLIDQLESAGVEIRWFRPLATWRLSRTDNRTHRKLLICDNDVGFTGGVGIAKEWVGDARNPDEWRDIHVRFEGPSLCGLRAAFIEHWNETGTWCWDEESEWPEERADGVAVQIIRASSEVGWTDIATLMRSLVCLARREILIVTAYFVPDPTLVDLLIEAHDRGVHVRILKPGSHSDSPLSQLAGLEGVERLLAAGVEVHQYERTMLHSKCLTVDGLLTCIGSANINRRSLGKDEECCAVILDEEATARLNKALARDLSHSRQLTHDEVRNRSVGTRIRETFARLVIEQV